MTRAIGYPIVVRHLRDDIQVREPLRAEGLVVHSTANPGATDEDHFKWLDAARRHGWTHYFVDWDSISQIVPEGLVAPGQGPTANGTRLSMELCEPSTKLPWAEQVRQFNEVWARGVWLAADIMFRYGWGMDRLEDHATVSKRHPNETDHVDPGPFFARFGRTWGQFVDAVREQLAKLRRGYPEAAPWQYDPVRRLQEAGLLHDLRHPRQPVEWWELGFMLERVREATAREVLEALRSSTIVK